MKTSIVIGKSGQVGRGLVHHLEREGHAVFSTSSKPGGIFLDLADAKSIDSAFVELQKVVMGDAPRVYLAGALTHVDLCEEKPDLCRQMNALGPIQVAELCKRFGWDLTFYSSEYVFGAAEYRGEKGGPFTEEDSPDPCCEYGRAKLEAERGILSILPEALVLRTVMVFSWDPTGMNFYMQYIRHLQNLQAGKKSTFRIPEDQISTPAYGPALSRASIELTKQKAKGIFNVVGPDMLSRKDLVFRVAESGNFSRSLVEEGFDFVKTADLRQKAQRPLTAGLTTEKAKKLGVTLPSLQDAFKEIQALRLKQPL